VSVDAGDVTDVGVVAEVAVDAGDVTDVGVVAEVAVDADRVDAVVEGFVCSARNVVGVFTKETSALLIVVKPLLKGRPNSHSATELDPDAMATE